MRIISVMPRANEALCPRVTASLTAMNYVRTHNRTEWAHSYMIGSSVFGIEQMNFFVVISPSDLPAFCLKLERKLARLHKGNPDRFRALLTAEVPTLPGYKWYVRSLSSTFPGQFVLADGENWAHAQELYLLPARNR